MEQFILHAFMSALGEARVVSRDKTAIGMELDIYVPFMSFAIEPGTWAFHKNAVERDKTKREECRKKGIRLITVYDSYPKNKRPPFQEDCIVFNYDYNTADHSYIRDLVVRLFELTGLSNTFTETKWNEIEQLAYRDARAKNTEEFINEITTIRSDIEILGTYVGSKIPITTKCKKCGKIWNARPANLLHGSNCPSCSKEQNTKRQTKSHEQFVEEVYEKQPQITILGKYIKGKAHVRAKCNVCGTVWDPVAASLLNGEGCPVCGAEKKGKGRRKTQKQYKEELFEANPNIELLSEYEGTTSPVRVRCKICGYEWTITARKLIYNPHHKSEYKMHAIMEQSSLE
ncbi:MAG: hypothetical protein E7241_07515 [Lachnospiraceae bacterium]|nr:hypothetical protein [Lachnospiraceae bacterium]